KTLVLQHVRIAPVPDLRMAIREGKGAAVIMTAGWPIPPDPIAGRLDAQAGVVDAVFIFVNKDGSQRRGRAQNVTLLVVDLLIRPHVSISRHPGIAHRITAETLDGSADH